MKFQRPTPIQTAILLLTLAATLALLAWRRSNPAVGWLATVESYAVALVWVAVLIASGLWKGRSRPTEEPVTYFNSAWNPEAVNGAGLFLGWLASKRLLSPKWSHDPDVESFTRRELTGPQLLENWGEKIVSEMLDERGNAFTLDYFAASDDYWDDYEKALTGLPATAKRDDWEAFEAVSRRIEKRFAVWRSRFPIGS